MVDGSNYLLTVNVSNNFKKISGVVINVLYYKDGVITDFSVSPSTNEDFELNNDDESLEISLDPTSPLPTDAYNITAGPQAKCYPNASLGPPLSETKPREMEDNEGRTFYCGGTWHVDSSNTSWMLKIQEYSFDPPNENVTIGDVDI